MADSDGDPGSDYCFEEHYYHTEADLEHCVPSTDILQLETVEQEFEGGEEEGEEESICKSNEEEEIELSPNGILDEETISRGLSNLGISADGTCQTYLNASIPAFSLVDISLLAEYTHLQRLDIPHNDITDLSPLGFLPHLLYLDASNNQVSVLLGFSPPHNLLEADFSYNLLTSIGDLSAHTSLRKLVLDYNSINEIDGLEMCRRLQYLSIAHNNIQKIQGLDNLPLKYLNLCHNQIKKVENLETLSKLQFVNLSANSIRSLKGLENHRLLETLDLEDNEIIDIVEISYIQNLRLLRSVNLRRNPIQELPDCRLAILFRIPCLIELDGEKVQAEEKVAARNMFDPSMEVVAARDHIMHTVFRFLQPARIWDSTLPNIETPYPMLVLVGPQGSGKKDLALKLVEEFSDYFGYGVSHTTRPPRPDEEHGKDYFFVTMEQFEMDIKMGQFLQTARINGHWFGLHMEAVESIAREGLACVVHMEIEGVLTLKKSYFEPRYVMLMPLNREAHEIRLRNRGLYTQEQKSNTLKRADIYLRYNQEHPGFFDMMINSEDIGEAYRRLRHLVMDYLGVSPDSPAPDPQPLGEGEEMEEGGKAWPVPPMATINAMGSRTWSRPSIPDSMTQGRAIASASGKGVVEEDSLRRRQSAAKDVVTGYLPPIFDQIVTQYPRTAPQSVEEQQGLGLEESDVLRTSSAPLRSDSKAPLPDIRGSPPSTASNPASRLSDLDSASEFRRADSPSAAMVPSKTQPTDQVDPLNLVEEQEFKSRSISPLSEPQRSSAKSSARKRRPMCNRHPILPPIVSVQ